LLSVKGRQLFANRSRTFSVTEMRFDL